MTDEQRLIYDLSLQCASLQVQRNARLDTSLEAQMLDAFKVSVLMYRAMSDDSLSEALGELKKVGP